VIEGRVPAKPHPRGILHGCRVFLSPDDGCLAGALGVSLLTLRVIQRGWCALVTLRVVTDGTYLPRFLGSGQLSVSIDAFA